MASRAVSTIPLTNLVVNGGFEVNTNGWTGYSTDQKNAVAGATLTSQALLAPGHGEVGQRGSRIGVKTQGVVYLQLATPITVIPGHKYYIRARVNLCYTAGSLASGCTIVNTTSTPDRLALPAPMSDGLQTTNTLGNWILIDSIWTADTTQLYLRTIWQVTANQGNNNIYGEIDNVVVVDLTNAFTAGLEPPIFAIRDGVGFSPPNGHWDGTTDITMPIPPVIETENLPLALKGREYYAEIELEQGTGTPLFSFSLDDLPVGHGLTINSDGIIAGKPNLDEGVYHFTVHLTDSIGYQVRKEFDLIVGEPPVIWDEFLVNPTVDDIYFFQPTITGTSPITTTIVVTGGVLPVGLSIVNDTIVGTPTIDGQTCQITITAYNKYDMLGSSKIFDLQVYSLPHINNNSPLPNATLGTPYSLTFSVSGIKPIEIEMLSGDLPLGIIFEDGVLSGTPTQTGTFSFSVRAANHLGSDTKLFILTVYEIPVIITTIFGYARLGTPYSGRLTATGSLPITYFITSGSLPPGLSLNQGTGIISGIALSSGSFPFTVVATNIAGNSQPRSFVINSGLSVAIITTSPLPSGTVNVPYPSLQLKADGADTTYSQLWSWVAESGSSLPPGLALVGNTGIISGTPTQAGVYTVHITVTNGPVSTTSPFTIEIGTPPTITTNPTLAGGVDRPFTIVLQSSGPTPISYTMTQFPTPSANIELDPNGALHWLIPEIGTYNFQVIATNIFGNSAPVNFSLIITTPAIIDVDLEYGIVGIPYLHQFSASGAAPFAWELIGVLPSGLAFDPQTATISGKPTTTGITNFEIKATNIGGFAQEAFSITIYAKPVILTNDLNSGNVGIYYSQILQSSGTLPIAYSIASGNLPDGLSLLGSTISGTPALSSEGTYQFTIKAQNLLGVDFADEQPFQIAILPSGAPIITTGSSLSSINGEYYELTLNANGISPITWDIYIGDDLPDGLTLDQGIISGTPTTPGIHRFTITATNTNGSDARTFTMTVGAPPTITKTTLANGITETFYADTLTADGDIPKTWSILPPSGGETPPPPGLALNVQTGVISGTPTQSGVYTFRIRVINNSGSDTQTFTITITSAGGTFINGKEIGRLFIRGKEVGEAYVGGVLIYKTS